MLVRILERPGSYAVVTKSWSRVVGDPLFTRSVRARWRSVERELVGRADQSLDDVVLEVVSGRVEHDNGRRRLARVHEEVGFGPPGTVGGDRQRNRQGRVQAEVTLGVHVAELPTDHERLRWPTRGAVVQCQGAGAVHRNVRWSAEHAGPRERLGEDGVDVSAVGRLLV